MPFKLVAPRLGCSPNYRIRGTYLRVCIDRTTGTPDRRLAERILARTIKDVEERRVTRPGTPTFAEAALSYLKAGDSRREQFLWPVVERLGTVPVDCIGQRDIDAAALAICPTQLPATRNRQVYTPISAILRHAGVNITLRRPKGAQGQRRTAYLREAEAFALLKAGAALSFEFGTLLSLLLYTGARLSEALRLTPADLHLDERTVYLRQSKTGTARIAELPIFLVEQLDTLMRAPDRSPRRVFRYWRGSRFYGLLKTAAKVADVELPHRTKFHLFRHTWATWMRKHAGLDTAGLVATGAWKSRQAASVYEHLDATEEARKVSLLPQPT